MSETYRFRVKQEVITPVEVNAETEDQALVRRLDEQC